MEGSFQGRGRPEPRTTTLGILAGGRASRLGGIDKAWLERGGVPQVLRCTGAFRGMTCATIVSANRELSRYRAHALDVVADREFVGQGPVAGLAAIAEACRTEWLLTVPVDLVEFHTPVAALLFDAAEADGAFAHDDDGRQPLVALWRVGALRAAVRSLADAGFAVRSLQAGLAMRGLVLHGLRFGNLNTAADLHAAGVSIPEGQQCDEARRRPS